MRRGYCGLIALVFYDAEDLQTDLEASMALPI